VNGRRPPGEQEPLEAARVITEKALGENARLYLAHIDSGRYTGQVIGTTSDHIIQKLNARSAVAHPKHLVPGQPATGQSLTISYSNGQAAMTVFEPRIKSKELAR
jgi:hypothetical protein